MKTITTTRPWGEFTRFTDNEKSTVKLLYVRAGEELSLQYHKYRDEFWKVVVGHPRITVGDDIRDSKPGEEFTVFAKVQHQISAPTDDVIILEISTGTFDEDDIVRIKDKYNRIQ